MLRSSPGCVGVTGSNNIDIAKNCMALNPCLQGVLSYVSEDASGVTSSTISQLPVACVRSFYLDNVSSCDIEKGYLPIFDLSSNSIVCKLICPIGYEARYNSGIQPGYVPADDFSCQPICEEGTSLRYVNGGFTCQ